MELDSKGLGRLRRVANARDVWTSEAGDFTSWLADNLDVLAEELGIPLTVVRRPGRVPWLYAYSSGGRYAGWPRYLD